MASPPASGFKIREVANVVRPLCAHCFSAHSFDTRATNVESRAPNFKQLLFSVRLAKRSRRSVVKSQEEGHVEISTNPAILLQVFKHTGSEFSVRET